MSKRLSSEERLILKDCIRRQTTAESLGTADTELLIQLYDELWEALKLVLNCLSLQASLKSDMYNVREMFDSEMSILLTKNFPVGGCPACSAGVVIVLPCLLFTVYSKFDCSQFVCQ